MANGREMAGNAFESCPIHGVFISSIRAKAAPESAWERASHYFADDSRQGFQLDDLPVPYAVKLLYLLIGRCQLSF